VDNSCWVADNFACNGQHFVIARLGSVDKPMPI
jgi:hypothetical protein